jgi:nicotinamidase-related amidase
MILQLPARHYSRYPFESPRGLVESTLELDLERTAFVLVDVYGKGFDEGDPIPEFPPLFLKRLHMLEAQIVREKIRPSLDAVRAARLPVVYVENRWYPQAWSGSEFAALCERTECGQAGTFDEVYIGTEYNEYSKVIAPLPSDIMVEKTMYDGFFETTLDTALRNLNAKHLVFAGFTADICLLNTVIGAMYRNYQVVILRDATLGSEFVDTVDEMQMTNWAIRYYEAMVGFTSTTDQWIEACRSITSSPKESLSAPASG